ncbi:MAG: hypothetical protein H6637_05220 [Ardenticatenales bacterium]|nr:hypothetical protein [Ardenticatenales bacterium]
MKLAESLQDVGFQKWAGRMWRKNNEEGRAEYNRLVRQLEAAYQEAEREERAGRNANWRKVRQAEDLLFVWG